MRKKLFGLSIVLLAAATSVLALADGFGVQFLHASCGRMVRIAVDGQERTTFAGKMAFRSEHGTWNSVCANLRATIAGGQTTTVEMIDSSTFRGNIRKAGNIVAKYFNEAQTPEQCAGLQLAVWEALEDGGDTPNFAEGHFMADADPIVLANAAKYYSAANLAGKAALLKPFNEVQAQLTTAPTNPTNGSPLPIN